MNIKQTLQQSLKVMNAKIIYVMVADLLFYISLFGIYVLFTKVINTIIRKLTANLGIINEVQNIFAIGTLPGPDSPLLEQAVTLKATFVWGIVHIILLALLTLAVAIVVGSLFKSFIWSRTLNQKFSLKYFLRFSLVSLAWVYPWIILFLVMAIGVKPQFMTFMPTILLLLFSYFTLIIYSSFTEKGSIKVIVGKAKLGMTRIKHFGFPALISLAVLAAYMVLTFLVASVFPRIISTLFITIAFLMYSAWVRKYFSLVTKHVA